MRRREDEGRRRYRRREGPNDVAVYEKNGSVSAIVDEDGYGALCNPDQSEKIYHDLCSLNISSPLKTSVDSLSSGISTCRSTKSFLRIGSTTVDIAARAQVLEPSYYYFNLQFHVLNSY